MRKIWVKVLKQILFYFGILAVIRRICPRKELAVLRYHAVCPVGTDYAGVGISVTPEGFRKQIRYLVKNYPVLDLEEAVDILKSGKTLPKNAVAITFDDGYRDNYTAYQILKEFGATATFFITTNCIDNKEIFWVSEVRYLLTKTKPESFTIRIKGNDEYFPLVSPALREKAVSKITRMIKSCTIPEREEVRKSLRSIVNDTGPLFQNQPLMLSSAQIEEMLKCGMKMGGHTLTHCNLPSAGIDAAREEIAGCRADLERSFGIKVTAFAYPNGGANAYFNEEVKRLVNEVGYYSAWTSQHGYVNDKTDWMQCPRLAVTESLTDLIYLMEGDRLRTNIGI